MTKKPSLESTKESENFDEEEFDSDDFCDFQDEPDSTASNIPVGTGGAIRRIADKNQFKQAIISKKATFEYKSLENIE